MKIVKMGNYVFIRHFLVWYYIDTRNHIYGNQPKKLFEVNDEK